MQQHPGVPLDHVHSTCCSASIGNSANRRFVAPPARPRFGRNSKGESRNEPECCRRCERATVGDCPEADPSVEGDSLDLPAERGCVMAFVQSIEFATEQRTEMNELMTRWTSDAIGTGTAQRSTLAEDRSNPGRFVLAVAFESAESAAQNSERPETGAFAAEFWALCSDGPTFRESCSGRRTCAHGSRSINRSWDQYL